ncbi:MAG: phosphoribosyltransferase family protein, partial [Smithellaceae bacterium]
RQRGFNQSLILAGPLSKKHGLPVNFSLLKRHKLTFTQTGLDKKQREKNMKDAFFVPKAEGIRDKNIILVDDVYTTGATTNECAKVLIRAGARNVAVITLARVPAHRSNDNISII